MTTITKLLSGLPTRTMDQPAFDVAMAQLMTDLPEWGAQVNAVAALINALSAGGAYALAYVFDTATADADPGAGKLRLSSTTQNAATVMRLDLTAGGQDYTSVLDTFDASTSAVKGSIRLVKFGDLTKWMTFDVTARATPSGYRNLAVTCTGSSSPSPFVNGDGLMLYFQRSGDRGTNGATVLLGSASVGSAVANIDFLNVFSSTYDRYTIEIQGANCSAAGNSLLLRFANGGTLDNTAVYTQLAGHGSSVSASPAELTLTATTQAAAGATLTIDVRNANSTGPKSIGVRGGYLSNASGHVIAAAEAFYLRAAAASGLRLYWTGGLNFTAGIVRVYGHINS